MADMTREQALALATARLRLQNQQAEIRSGDEPLFDPNLQRGDILPLARTQEGDLEMAAPNMLVDLYQSMKKAGTPGADPMDITEAAIGSIPMGRGVAPLMTKGPASQITKQQIKNAPSSQQLRKQADTLYKEADAMPDVVGKNVFSRKLAQLNNSIRDKGFDPDLHPSANSALKAISKRLGQDVDMKELQTIRQIAKDAAGVTEPKDARIGKIMLNEVEKIITGLTSEGGKKLKAADTKYGQSMKVRAFNEAIEDADLQASGVENGLRIAFRQMLRNKKAKKYFTEDEKEMMREVVKGTPLTNILKKASKVGVGSGQQSNQLMALLSATVGAGAGGAMFGPLGGMVGATALPAVGTMAGKAGERATLNAAERAKAYMAGVRPEQTRKFVSPQAETLGRLGISQGLLQLLNEGA